MATAVSAFSILNGMLTSELPGIKDRATLSRAYVEEQTRRAVVPVHIVSLANFTRLEQLSPLVGAVAGECAQTFAVRTAADTVSAYGAFVSADYFAVLGTEPLFGRLLTPQDNRADADTIVVGATFWRRHLGGERDAVGRTLFIAGRAFRVVGVAPDRFTGLDLAGVGDADESSGQIWIPLPLVTSWPGAASTPLLTVVVRSAAGATREEAARELTRLVTASESTTGQVARGIRLREYGYGPNESTAETLTVVGAFLLPPLIVLAIACANVANLRLARATSRVRELAVRISLGATRGRIVRLLAIEAAVLTAAAALVAWALTRIVLIQFGGLFPVSVSPDLAVALFTALISVGVVFFSGVAPAWRVARALQRSGLRQTAQAGGIAQSRLRNVLVGAQVALSLGLLVIGALSARTAIGVIDRTAAATDPLVMADIDLTQIGYDVAAASRFADTVLERLSSDGRIQAAGFTDRGLFRRRERLYTRAGEPDAMGRTTHVAHVTPGWFGAMGLHAVSGRLFTTADRRSPVVVVNETLARALEAAGGPAVGASLAVRGLARQPKAPYVVSVIGIVPDAARAPDRPTPDPAIYVPLQTESALSPILFVRTADPARLIPDLRRLLTDIEPRAPWAWFETGPERLAREMSPIRYFAMAVGSLGLLALALATAGLYAVTLFATSLRTREIGIRMAIGARQADVVRLVLRQSLIVVGIGAGAGLLIAIPAAIFMRALFVGISPLDPLALGPAVVTLLVAAIAAAALPALRASRVDPVQALRQE
jgi:predicted permease